MQFTEEQLKAALEKNSDFAFEMEVLNLLISLRFDCEHSGTYVDPIRQRAREFDIRGTYVPSTGARWNFAVECKNIINTPLIVHRVPRAQKESFHQTLSTRGPLSGSDGESSYGEAHISIIETPTSPYRKDTFVGKAMDQAVQDGKNGVKLNDSEVFDKFSQALSSSGAILSKITETHPRDLNHAILPILVVPAGSLWAIDYSKDGKISKDLHRVDHVQYYVNKSFAFKAFPTNGLFTITHLEIVTPEGLKEICKEYVLCF